MISTKELIYRMSLGEGVDELMNTLPEIEYIPLPKYTPTDRLMLDPGTYLKIASSPPKTLEETTEINPEFDEVMSVFPYYRYKGVRHNTPIGMFTVYSDPYISHARLFPVNLTKYFYKLERGKSDRLVPVKYSDVIATNVAGMLVKTKHCLGYHVMDYGKLILSMPKGAIVIIKEENKESLEMIFASGAISTTNPWVKGCGVTDEGEDFFKPETEKIKKNGKEIGCRIDINKERMGGFYCPEPYKVDPPECFQKGYERNKEGEEVVELNEMFESREWRNTAFRYITIPTQFKKRIRMIFKNKKTYICYCRTIKGKEMARIEIRI
nr:hypothetical protein MACL_00002795 [Theileria orientalis]